MTGERLQVGVRDGVVDCDVPSNVVVFVDGLTDLRTGWGRCYPDESDVERRAGADLVAAAIDAVGAAANEDPGPIEVVGKGALAEVVRHLLDVYDEADPDAPPAVVIETTGSPTQIARAVGAVARLGVVIFAAQPIEPDLDLRTYADVHVRGLTLVGIDHATMEGAHPHADELTSWTIDRLGHAVPGKPMPPGLWHSIRSR